MIRDGYGRRLFLESIEDGVVWVPVAGVRIGKLVQLAVVCDYLILVVTACRIKRRRDIAGDGVLRHYIDQFDVGHLPGGVSLAVNRYIVVAAEINRLVFELMKLFCVFQSHNIPFQLLVLLNVYQNIAVPVDKVSDTAVFTVNQITSLFTWTRRYGRNWRSRTDNYPLRIVISCIINRVPCFHNTISYIIYRENTQQILKIFSYVIKLLYFTMYN